MVTATHTGAGSAALDTRLTHAAYGFFQRTLKEEGTITEANGNDDGGER
jgi:hypothetical protein